MDNSSRRKAATPGIVTARQNKPCHYLANSAHLQRQRIAEWFITSNSLTTEDARRDLDIMHPAGRIKEMRSLGFEIMTVWESYPTIAGNMHRMARYVFMGMRGAV